jgi:hypothetical protein
LQQLEAGLRAPAASQMLSYGALKLFPVWDPLRGDPRFEKIVASLAPKESKYILWPPNNNHRLCALRSDTFCLSTWSVIPTGERSGLQTRIAVTERPTRCSDKEAPHDT